MKKHFPTSQKFPKLTIVGVMSGSSLDGLDIAVCQFYYQKNQIQYKVLSATTVQYPTSILNILQNIRKTSSLQFFEQDVIYGKFIGKKISDFLKKNKLSADAVSVHGHTVFHYPEKGFSVQLGNASQIAAACQLPVIHNFRNLDIAMGGQGAPLVPIGDKLLFSNFDACANIGGIANVFIQKTNIAFDICIANMALNYFAQQQNKKYDKNGSIAKKGKVHQPLLDKLNSLPFILQNPPKSLNREYFEKKYLPLISKYQLTTNDILATLVEHIAQQISKSFDYYFVKNVLITGGGSFNQYLIERIKFYSKNKKIHLPDNATIKYKEAIIFALLGYLRILTIPNTLHQATGAIKNLISGEFVDIE
jgi:anhydro-N-acetylmuramic acid kinase